MPNNNWIGGASVATQIDTLMPGGTIEVGDKFKVTMTGEDNSTDTESVSATGTTVAQVATDIFTALDSLPAATRPLFDEVNWIDQTTHVEANAKVKGKPFKITVVTTESDDSAADAQTFVQATTTANSGPEDAGTAANFSLGTVLAAGEDFRVMPNPDDEKSYNIKYGLAQSAKDLKSFRRSPEYEGTIGDPANKFYFQVDVSDVGGGNVPYVTLHGNVGETWLDGLLDEVRVYETSRSKNAVKLKGTIGVLRMNGPGVVGKVNVASGAALTTFSCLNCPNAEYEIDTSVVGLTTTHADTANGIIRSACTTINTAWQAILRHTAGAVSAWNNFNGAHVYYNGSGTLTQGDNYGGVFDFTENIAASVTVTLIIVHAGLLLNKNRMNNISYGTIRSPGGTVDLGEDITVAA